MEVVSIKSDWKINEIIRTSVGSLSYFVSVVPYPRGYRYVVLDVTGNLTFKDSNVASDDVVVVHLYLILLFNGCHKKRKTRKKNSFNRNLHFWDNKMWTNAFMRRCWAACSVCSLWTYGTLLRLHHLAWRFTYSDFRKRKYRLRFRITDFIEQSLTNYSYFILSIWRCWPRWPEVDSVLIDSVDSLSIHIPSLSWKHLGTKYEVWK